jgi:cell division septum initiation protein DivIVA
MSEKMKTMEDENFSISDEILKALTGKVAESGSAVNENTVLLKKVIEMTSKLPAIEKRLDSMEDRVWKMEKCVDETSKSSKQAIDKMGERIDVLASSISLPAKEIGAYRQDLLNHARLFEKPLHKEVHYRHFLGWPIVVVILAVLGAICMFGLWQDASNRVSEKEQNDIKYRYVKLSGDSTIQKRVDSADQAWLADPGQFKKAVEADEELMSENTANNMRKERLDSETRELRRPKRRQ